MFTDDQTRQNEAIELPPVVDVAMEEDDALDHIVLQSIELPPVLDNSQTDLIDLAIIVLCQATTNLMMVFLVNSYGSRA